MKTTPNRQENRQLLQVKWLARRQASVVSGKPFYLADYLILNLNIQFYSSILPYGVIIQPQ
ncbi:hypothetical protein NLX71_23775 [Paenibacillus sp. MZ04-78.2]|uniref:hypothetical protein n=1 Tax=Paenibacillus sp. MZ04-78.2 TaxID=2962034 RepID=UPI0020B8B0E6|nr:hypothetical protein [Paenibacillus sp. MZ04-78.2]MCP3776280.1 hypothetical protein [Paenibacillus sp. MZ04-78.2]